MPVAGYTRGREVPSRASVLRRAVREETVLTAADEF